MKAEKRSQCRATLSSLTLKQKWTYLNKRDPQCDESTSVNQRSHKLWGLLAGAIRGRRRCLPCKKETTFSILSNSHQRLWISCSLVLGVGGFKT